MHFDIEVYKGDLHLEPDTAIQPGELLRVTVEADEEITGMKIEIFDPSGNMRMMSRRKGHTGEFKTQFPQTKTYGEWKITVTAKSLDGDVEQDTEIILIQSTAGKQMEQPPITNDEMPQDEFSPEINEVESDLDEGQEIMDSEEMEEESSDDHFDEGQEETEDDGVDDGSYAVDEEFPGDSTEEELEESEEASKSLIDEIIEDEEETIDEVQTDANNLAGDLTAVKGIGKATATKLIDKGITTIQLVADATIVDIMDCGINRDQAVQIIENAKNFLDETAV